MKRATRTRNHSIISTQSWPVKGLALFLILLALGSCQDETGLIGNPKNKSRFGVYFKEFDIPVTTVQSDSIRFSIAESLRVMCGGATDPNFGLVDTKMFAQFSPELAYTSAPKIDLTGKSNFNAISLTINFIIDYYVYGDTSNKTLAFALHKIKPENKFDWTKSYYNFSGLDYESEVLASASFAYIQDSIKDHRKRNTDGDSRNDRYDTIRFELPIENFGEVLLDSAKAKGVYSTNKTTGIWEIDKRKTDSVFRISFPGFAVIASEMNARIMGVQANYSEMILRYSYVKDGATVNSSYSYLLKYPTFSSVNFQRSGTPLDQLSLGNKYQDFNAPDQYAYLQAGTGIYAKLDFTEVHNYFDADPDTIKNMAINAAELVVDAESETDRNHLSKPMALYFRVLKNNNRFFSVPINESTGAYDAEYGSVYYCSTGSEYLDAIQDNPSNGRVILKYSKVSSTNRQVYSSYVTEFFERFLRSHGDFNKIQYMALLPADDNFGRSFYGLSFRKDKVKLRIYYTKTL